MSLDTALNLRKRAMALLDQAEALDGLHPFVVTHRHNFGQSSYVLWARTQPAQEDAELVLDATFDPDDEELTIEGDFTLEEFVGVSPAHRLLDLIDEKALAPA